MSLDTIIRMMTEETRLRLARHPEAQAEAIACHYSRMAALAIHLRELTKIRRLNGPDKDTDAVIAMLTKDIQEAHLKDLGIPLEWKCDEALYRDRTINSPSVSSGSDLRLDSW